MNNYYKELVRILSKAGWYPIRQKGSHHIWSSPDGKKSVPVPTTCRNKYTANGILKQAGIAKKF